MKIKALPQHERPMEKVLDHGIEALSNTELLALIIHTGSGKKSAIHLAEEVISGSNEGLAHLGELTYEELVSINGIGRYKACTLLASIELGKRIASAPREKRISIDSTSAVADMFMEEMRYLKKEHFKTLMVNSKGEVIFIDDVSVGELTSTVVHPREVYEAAIRKRAVAVVFIHNHPSGDPTPSGEDVITNRRLVESGEILGIRVLDHIIIGDGEYSSMRALDLFD